MRRARSALLAFGLALATGQIGAAESDPLPIPQGTAAARSVRAYNEGVALLLERKFVESQRSFEAALALDELFAEAHNNLAFALRMQGRHNFEASLRHYDRAIALKPGLAQAYMYRGVLFVQQGDLSRARQDLETLRRLDPRLALDLQRVVEGGSAGADRGGIAAQYE